MTPPTPRRWLVSADLGQAADPTAIGLFERLPTHDVVRSLERPDLGTPYTDIVRRLGVIVRNSALSDGVDLLLDATGVGRPVVDLAREELRGVPGVRLVAIVIGSGITAAQNATTGYWTVPKKVLVVSMQVALQSRKLRVAQGLALASTLVDEMRSFKLKVSVETGHQSFEAWRSGDHDDLVLMAAMGAWWSSRLTRPAAPHGSDEAAELKAEMLRRQAKRLKEQRDRARVQPWRR